MLGGRDEQSGGTWLAVNEHGVCAGLTNQPLGDAKDRPSARGATCRWPWPATPRAAAAVEALRGPGTGPRDYNGSLAARRRPHLAVVRRLHGPAPTRHGPVALPPGIHVLENRALGEPSAKVDLVRAALGGAPRAATPSRRPSVAVLADHRIPEGDERPNSANCVHLDTFGTRSSCLVRVADGPARRPACGWRRAAVHHALRGRRLAVGAAWAAGPARPTAQPRTSGL